MKKVDIAIVGAGIIGLAHAFHAAQAGMSVAVFERSAEAKGASVRNFGMLALNAQASGEQLISAQKTLTWWQEIAPQAGIELRQSGCMFVARAAEEMALLNEFSHSPAMEKQSAIMVEREDLSRYSPSLRSENIIGAMWSSETWKIDQRQACRKLAVWLKQKYGVKFYFLTDVQNISPPYLITSAGQFNATHTIICSGNDFAALFPDDFQKTGIKNCQLQMMRTYPQPMDWQLGPFIMGGLSMTHYKAFSNCSSLQDLVTMQKERFRSYIKHGIHVIVGQEPDGRVTIGDSHAYGTDLNLPRSKEVDNLILHELSEMMSLPVPRIEERWLGQYAYLPEGYYLKLSPRDGVTAVTQTSGQGMTHGLSISKDVILEITG